MNALRKFFIGIATTTFHRIVKPFEKKFKTE